MLSVKDTVCMYCNKKTPEKILADKVIRHLPENEIFGGKLRIVQCRKCGLRYLNPMPALHDLSAIYDFDTYADSTNANQFLQEYFLSLTSRFHHNIKNVLEIGCGTGEFLSFLQKKGMTVSGVEFADSSNRIKFAGNLYVGRIEDIEIEPNQYDAVYLLNVIEHLIDPVSTVRKINHILKEDGLLILRHPNSDMFFNVFYKYLVEYPKYLLHLIYNIIGKKTKFSLLGFINQHLFYFNYATISKVLVENNYGIIFYSTKDPFNEYRITKCFKERKYVEGMIASIRGIMSYFRMGTECILVAKKRSVGYIAQ